MDLHDSPEEAAFRAEARAWLEAHARPKTGPDSAISLFSERAEDESGWVRASQGWQRTKYDAGWAGITWPKEHGGRAGSAIQSIIFGQEEGRFDVPTGLFTIGHGMIGPTIMACGSAAQKQRYLSPMLRGDEIWCQLFSEPGAGSDVASLGTRAVRDGDEWVISGQKVWTSGAHYSDFGEIITRTDPDAPKHRGITAFVVPMKDPAVTTKPLRQMTGGANFNEVFFDELRVPDANRLGDVNAGWGVAITTLMNERVAIGGGGGGGASAAALFDLARHTGAAADPVVRQDLVDVFIQGRVNKYNGYRIQTAISRGAIPGPEGSVAKLLLTRMLTKMGDVAVGMLGPNAIAATPDSREAGWASLLVGSPGMSIAGGTEQIMKNIIAERVLGLPGDVRVDKDVAWKDIPRSA